MIKLPKRPELLGFLTAMLLPLATSAEPADIDYSDKDNWLCRPDNLRFCDTDMTTTVVQADGSTHREDWQRNDEAPIDCFYVYPTVSRDATANSDMDPGPEEANVIRAQFARLGSQCRLFAPIYRQITLTALRGGLSGDNSLRPDREMGYRDVLNAWNYYLEHHNDGRGVVLIGHSQGSGVLSRLIPAEIEGKLIQDQIISALIIGSNVMVPKGKKVGGTFKHMPLCESAEQLGCVIAYASYRADLPPPSNSLFGRNGRDRVAACTNPAELAKGSKELHAYLSNTIVEGISSEDPPEWVKGKRIDTPFVSVPGLLSAECVSGDDFSYLAVSVHGDPSDPRTDDITGDVVVDGEVNTAWGLHLVDVNLAMGDLVSIVAKQAQSYLAKQ